MKRIMAMLFGLACLMLLTACGEEQIDQTKVYSVYYVSNSETKIEMHEYYMMAEELEDQVAELLAALAATPSKLEYKAPLAMGFQVQSAEVNMGKVHLDVSEEYNDLSVTTEVLVRAAIVRTLTQINQINFVYITVNGNPLLDSLGNIVSTMNRDQFVENDGNAINTYEEVKIKLYFANEAGDQLIAANRTREYSTNISLEKLIVEELIKGPSASGLYPTINPSTKVASVTVRDGVCYVNLDDTFLTQPYNVSADVTIYSITNSLAELSNVNRVQIFINGDNTVTYREKYSFTTYFERNLDIVTTLE
ncbi:MAG: GerMN domain-containing protein [bacterium]|nr:GerMN domain-containing protein [bacterium]MCM1375382.1 GerMN domain-containing protein [Muribaculum sp.]